MPSTLLKQVSGLTRCITELEKNQLCIEKVCVTESYSQVFVKYSPRLKQFHGIDRGVINDVTGRFITKSISLHGVAVMWFEPFYLAKGGVHVQLH